MPQNPEISVLIPVYNSQKYLAQCLDSVVRQTFNNFEVICLNDGSKDASLDILNMFAARDARIKVIDSVNKGVAEARNALVAAASGKYIAFIDADDSVELDYLGKLYSAAEDSGADIARCEFVETRGGGLFQASCSSNFYKKPEDGVAQRIKAGYYDSIVWGRVIKKSLVTDNAIVFPKGHVAEDLFFTMMCFVFAKKIVFVEEKLYIYRKDNENAITSGKNQDKMLFGRLENLLAADAFLESKGKYDSDARLQMMRLLTWHLSSLRKISDEGKTAAQEVAGRVLSKIAALSTQTDGIKTLRYKTLVKLASMFPGKTYFFAKVLRS